MTKVEQGISINLQHLQNVMNGVVEDVSFNDQILALGYSNMMEFFEEKALYEMHSVLQGNVFSVQMSDLLPHMYKLINDGQFGIVSIHTDGTCVCRGNNVEKLLDEAYCHEHNIPIYPYDSFGGTIVATEGDFGLAILIPSVIDVSIDIILEQFKSILKTHFEDVTVEGNDILIDGKKVAGSGSFGDDVVLVLLFYFSMSDKGDLISNICGEPITGKKP